MNSEFLRSGRDFIPSLLSQGVEEVGGFVPPTRLCKMLNDFRTSLEQVNLFPANGG